MGYICVSYIELVEFDINKWIKDAEVITAEAKSYLIMNAKGEE